MSTEALAGEKPREQWGSRLGFILAAIGSAIGLGNIWRYPAVVYDNGGGAFLIPYFIALATAGIPLLILEYALGHRSRRAAPFAFRQLSRRWEWLGWWQIAVSFMIMTYYVVVIGWVISYFGYSFGARWGEDPNTFFNSNHLEVSEGFWQMGGVRWPVLLSVAIAWALTYTILRGGVRRGIEIAAKVLIPVLIVMMIIITIRGITLPGAAAGLDVLLTPDFSALRDIGVWIAAYGQVFFSLSVGFSIMIAYSSYLRRRSDLANTGVIVGLSNAGFEFLSAIGVFAVLGFLATQLDTEVTEVARSGVALAFIAFPQIINELPGSPSVWGVLFFGSLLIAGITSAVSILECGIAGLRDKFQLSRTAAVNWICGLCALVSVLYATRGGVYYLDTADKFLNTFGLVLAGLGEIILVAWVARKLGMFRDHINVHSYLRVGPIWMVCLALITPVVLIGLTAVNFVDTIRNGYEGYPTSGLLAFGWGAVFATVIAATLVYALRGRRSDLIIATQEDQ